MNKQKIQKDLDAGKFNQICSNETNFKEYVFSLIDETEKQAQKEMREIIENMPTEFPERESDEYDRAYKDAKEYLINKIK